VSALFIHGFFKEYWLIFHGIPYGQVIETVMRWRFMEQRSLGEGMEELSTVALGLHHFLTHSDTTCKQRATFRRPTLRIMTFALRLSQRRKKYQTHFSLSLQGILDVIQWVESEGSDSGFDIETSQETRALALQMLLQCSTPAASTHEVGEIIPVVAKLMSFDVMLTIAS
jgi:nucleolar pre-ribosomal-associated protein 1